MHIAATNSVVARSGAPSIMMPQSIGPFSRRRDEKLACYAIQGCPLVVARDRESVGIAEALLGRKARLCPDVAFYGWQSIARPDEPTVEPDDVVMIPMDWTWAREGERDRLLRPYLRSMAEIIRHLRSHDLRVALLGHSLLPEQAQDDCEIAGAIRALLPPDVRSSVSVISPASADHGAEVLGSARVVIGTRLHSCIVAITRGTPAIHIAYQPKGRGLYSLLGLEQALSQYASGSAQHPLRRLRSTS